MAKMVIIAATNQADNQFKQRQKLRAKKPKLLKTLCGMEVSDIKKAPSEEYKGKVYYFCSEHCKKTFKKDPASHIPTESSQHGEGEGHKH